MSKDLSEHKSNQICNLDSNNELNQSAAVESLLLECENLFDDNDEWKESISESIDEAIVEVQSKENNVQRKYEKVIKLRDAVIDEKNDLKSKIEVKLLQTLSTWIESSN